MKLTVKQKKFIDLYIETGNATKAAIQAGYSKKTARRIATENLSKPVLKSAIASRMSELQSERVASAQEVVEFLSSSMRGEIVEEVVSVVPSDGVVKTKKQIGAKDRVKAAELLAKRYSLLTPETQINLTPVIITGEEDIRE